MVWYDWLILVLPVCFVMYMGYYSRKYIRGVSDYLAAGRICGRYVISAGDLANGLSIIGLVTYLEGHYKTGFSVAFWGNVLAPLSIILALTGYCHYRFRETKAMSLGQFLEMRYSRAFRIFASGLRSLAEMLANMIMPALAARFFIQILDLPDYINVFGLKISMFVVLCILFLTLAITLICWGGTLCLIITDTIQGMFMYPILACFVIFLMYKFSLTEQVMPTMMDRVQGESFINPYDTKNLRDFNLFSMVIVVIYGTIMNRVNWTGAGYSSAAKSPHEQKMAGLLGSWRGAIVGMFYVLIACGLITFLNHKDFANEAIKVRQNLATRVADDVFKDPQEAYKGQLVKDKIATIKPQIHEIVLDGPEEGKLSQDKNLDTEFLDHIHTVLKDDAREKCTAEMAGKDLTEEEQKEQYHIAEGYANDLFQRCRTLYYQLSMSVTMRNLLPSGLFGLFCLLLFLAMVSTDDTRIYSAALTIAQDCVLPFKKKPFTPKGHVWMIRIVSICIGIFFLFGSCLMKQLDYIQMYVALVCSMFTRGAGPVMVFGLYSRFGTTAGAWAALLTSTVLSVAYAWIQRSWADVVCPFIKNHNMYDGLDSVLQVLSKPFGGYIDWKMDDVKCPVNPVEFAFFLSLFTLILYVVVSLLTCKKPFNLERMLHRGKYALGEQRNLKLEWNAKSIFKNIIGITPEYTKGDRAIAYSVFIYSFVYGFCIMFLGVVIWNQISPWKLEYWSWYFIFGNFIVAGLISIVSTLWFGIGGVMGLFELFRDLKARTTTNDLDDGRVEGEMSLADKQELEALDMQEASGGEEPK